MWSWVESWTAKVCSLCAGLFNRAVLWSKTAGGTGFKLDNAHCQKCKSMCPFSDFTQCFEWVLVSSWCGGLCLWLLGCRFVKFNWNGSSVPRCTSTSIAALRSAAVECSLTLRFVCSWRLGRREKIVSDLCFRVKIVCSGPFNLWSNWSNWLYTFKFMLMLGYLKLKTWLLRAILSLIV